MIIDYDKIEPALRYKLTSNSVIPRPIAWIVTKNEIVNIAPFSYFTPLSSNPPVLIVSIGHKSDGSPKDTLSNIRETKKCTICIASHSQYEKLHLSSKALDKNESEAEIFDIKVEEAEKNFPPIVSETPIAFFCELYQEIDLKGSKTIPLILEIKSQYVNDKFINNDLKINFDALARVGANYAKLGKILVPPKIL